MNVQKDKEEKLRNKRNHHKDFRERKNIQEENPLHEASNFIDPISGFSPFFIYIMQARKHKIIEYV